MNSKLQAFSNIHFIIANNQTYCIIARGKGAMQKRVGALRDLRRLLSKSEFPPVEAALKAGAIPILVQCLSFGSPDEQVYLILLLCIICIQM